jgi:hypothetical protein
VEHTGLFRGRSQHRTIAEGVDLKIAVAQEPEIVPTARMVQRIVGKLELLGSRTNGNDHGAEVKSSHGAPLFLERLRCVEAESAAGRKAFRDVRAAENNWLQRSPERRSAWSISRLARSYRPLH